VNDIILLIDNSIFRKYLKISELLLKYLKEYITVNLFIFQNFENLFTKSHAKKERFISSTNIIDSFAVKIKADQSEIKSYFS
jgi:hypothetical protein